MINLTFLTMNEVLAKADKESTFLKCLKDDAHFITTPSEIVANFQDWFGLTVDADLTDAEVKAKCINLVDRWTSWLVLKAYYLEEKSMKYDAISGEETEISKYVDTPEMIADFSGDTHTTNVTKLTRTANVSGAKYAEVKPWKEMLIHDFRKTWLTPPEVL